MTYAPVPGHQLIYYGPRPRTVALGRARWAQPRFDMRWQNFTPPHLVIFGSAG